MSSDGQRLPWTGRSDRGWLLLCLAAGITEGEDVGDASPAPRLTVCIECTGEPRAGGDIRPLARDLDRAVTLAPRDVATLASRGPPGHPRDRAALAALEAGLPAWTAVSARFRISVFAPIR